MQLIHLDMKNISNEEDIYNYLTEQMNFTDVNEKPEWMYAIEMDSRDPYEMDTEEGLRDPELEKLLNDRKLLKQMDENVRHARKEMIDVSLDKAVEIMEERMTA